MDLATENAELRGLVDRLLFGSGFTVEDADTPNPSLHIPAGPAWGTTITPGQATLIAEIRKPYQR